MFNFKIFDAHCDTATKILDTKQGLLKNDADIDIKKLSGYENYAQIFAIFISPEYYGNPKKRFNEVYEYFKDQLRNNEKIRICTNDDEIQRTWKNDKIGAFLSLEGGECIERCEDIDTLYDKGIRMINLTWNNDNALGGGAFGKNIGLSEMGKRTVEKMNEKGIIVDVSHLCEKSFYDVCEYTKKPIIASHSSSYKICPNKRNLTDEQFEKIKSLNGVVGINMYPLFLTGRMDADIKDILLHTEHFLSLNGENNIGLGTDFDGIDFKPQGISGADKLYIIFNEFAKIGISEAVIEKIAYKNMRRIIKVCL